jgi:hypothetical protein
MLVGGGEHRGVDAAAGGKRIYAPAAGFTRSLTHCAVRRGRDTRLAAQLGRWGDDPLDALAYRMGGRQRATGRYGGRELDCVELRWFGFLGAFAGSSLLYLRQMSSSRTKVGGHEPDSR